MIKFKQEPADDGKALWEVIVGDDKQIIYGRPDAEWLIGFGPKGVQDVTVLTKDVLANPALAVGLVPTFTGRGDMFSVDLVVTECEAWDRPAEHVEKLHARELEMRGFV